MALYVALWAFLLAGCGHRAHAIICSEDEFRCVDGSDCIPADLQCDGIATCSDRSDELFVYCVQLTDQWPCGDFSSVPIGNLCDGVDDCPGGTDEAPAFCSNDTECDDLSQFTCLTGECIPIEGLCDGTPNCIDAGDEHPLFCGGFGSGIPSCPDGETLGADGFCSGFMFCDELMCDVTPDPSDPFFSAFYYYDCCYEGSGTPMCSIDGGPAEECSLEGEIYVFDYSPGLHSASITVEGTEQVFTFTTPVIRLDCNITSDTANTNYTYRCVCSSSSCTPSCTIDGQDMECDLEDDIYVFDFPPGVHTGTITVFDGNEVSNTEFVQFFTPVSCRGDEFLCVEDDYCILGVWVCDGFPDCSNATDESFTRCGPNVGCDVDEFSCNNTACIRSSFMCDGDNDCGDSSDESEDICGLGCLRNQYDCGNGECIPADFECDGFRDCSNGTDEESCDDYTGTDGSAEGSTGCDFFNNFQCENGQCIPESFRCDGLDDCFDESDELFCGLDCFGGDVRIGNETDGFTETGQYITGGLVQICLDGVYHTICDVGFDEMAAEIACRSQFGDSYYPFHILTRADFVGSLPLNRPGNVELTCNGTQFSLSECDRALPSNSECLNPNNTAGVVCVEEPNRCRYEGELRLANQTSIFSGTDEYLGEAGRIEVCFSGVWGLVCDLNWREEDAQVACRHFGYSSPQYSGEASYGSEYGNGSGEYWLGDLACIGTESNLNFCSGVSFLDDQNECTASGLIGNAAGIFCREDPNVCFFDGEIRLANTSFQETSNGGYRQTGRVDICFNGTYGSVCGDDWTEENTQVACRHFFGETFYGYTAIPMILDPSTSGNGNIWIQNIICNESAFSLYDCDRTALMDFSNDCFSIAGIICIACDDDQFRCSDGQCLSPQRRCDGYFDCPDYSDEEFSMCGGNVTIPVPQECNSTQFSCENGECIRYDWVCDGYDDCQDNSDEEICGDCPIGSYECLDGACIPDYWECNRVPDCSFEEDEFNCTGPPSPGDCDPDEFQCSNRRCIPRDSYCNGRDNCGDLSDELYCSDVCRLNGTIRLANITIGLTEGNMRYVGGRVEICYNGSYADICDLGWNDISAELACLHFLGDEFRNVLIYEALDRSAFGDGGLPVIENLRCLGSEVNLLQCASGELGGDLSEQCRYPGRSAAVRCILVCELDEFSCRDGGGCVPLDSICDSVNDCDDMSDESSIICDLAASSCNHPTLSSQDLLPPEGCDESEYECESNGRCISDDLLCNGVDDCARGSDEQRCNTTIAPPAPPSGLPLGFSIVAVDTTALRFRWNPPIQQERNGIITSYTLTCTPELLLDDFPREFDEPGEVTINGFLPGTNYTCSIYASNDVGNGPSIARNATTMEGFRYLPFIALDPFDDVSPIYLARRDDGSSQPISIPGGIPVGDDVMTVAYVNTNGMISFGSGFTHWFPRLFPSTDFTTRMSYLAAPFWSDVDIRREGNIYYVVYRRGETTPFGNRTLERVSTLVSNQTGTNFSGSWMLLAHWDRVHPYPHGSYRGPLNSEDEYQNFVASENTYQGVIISDGIVTYAIYTHHCDLLEWGGFGNNAVVGYSLRGTYYMNHPLSGLDDIDNIGCLNQSSTDWTNLVYRISVSVDDLQLQRAECMKLYAEDIELYGDISKIPPSLEPCPCTYFQAIQDGRFRFDSTNFGCFYQTFGSRSGSAQYCCYSLTSRSFGALLGEPAGLFGSSLLLFHPITNASFYARRDVAFRQTCCAGAGLCNLFFERRPSDACRNYQPVFPTWALGDPHFTTLDGKNFTFNGFGEYTLLQVQDGASGFTLQGRTEPASADTTATVFSAFAFGNLSAVIEIQRRADELLVLYDGIDVTRRIAGVNDSYNVTAFHPLVTRVATNSIRTSFPLGVTVEVSIAATIPNFVVRLPQNFSDSTSGLLGNFNGNPDDDFMYPNGIDVLRSDATDREIHGYAQQWQISAPISLFTYPSGMTVDDFSKPSHRPVYLDEVVMDVMANNGEIATACGNNPQCIFDYSQTNDMDVGMATLATTEENMMEQTQALNNPPQLDGARVFEVTVGQESVYLFTVTETDEGDTFTVELDDFSEPNSALNDLGGGAYSFTWTLMEPREVLLTFIARDSQNGTAVMSPQLQICGCANNGVCTMNGVTNTDGGFILLECDCTEAWDGRYCEEDANGCALLTCFEGVQCFDMTAPDVGAACGTCPTGYEGDGEKCADTNECNTTNECGENSVCFNTEGSFECRCASGYQEVSDECQDVDECSGLNDCEQECTNTPGSYTCDCRNGFVLDNDQRSCVVLGSSLCPEINVCDDENGLCTLVAEVEICDCLRGYELASDQSTCEDIDECMLRPCDYQCDNINGSFLCECRPGYTLSSDGRTCLDTDECVEAAMVGRTLCPESEVCSNTLGTFECVCPAGTDNTTGVCQPVVVVEPTRVMLPVNTPQGTPAAALLENSLRVTLRGFTSATFDSARQIEFKIVTADAITDFCGDNPDECDARGASRRKRAAFVVLPGDVNIASIINTADGVEFLLYVLIGGGLQVLTPSSLEATLDANNSTYVLLGYSISYDRAVEASGVSTRTIIIAAVCGGVGALLLLLLVVLVIICIVTRTPSAGPKPERLEKAVDNDYSRPTVPVVSMTENNSYQAVDQVFRATDEQPAIYPDDPRHYMNPLYSDNKK